MGNGVVGVIRNGARNLAPSYFALVMATGIVSIAAGLMGMPRVSRGLFGINIFFYGALWILTLIRVFRDFPRVAADLTSHERGHGFLTLVAGTCVLGRQFHLIAGDIGTASVLWLVGLALWGLILYTFIAAVTVRETKPGLESGLSGGWLLLVVSTQSITVTGAGIARSFGPAAEVVLFLSLSLFLLGFLLYLLVICLIFYRFTFFRFSPQELSPPYWINMGAMAITTLAGSVLILEADHWRIVAEIMPFLKGITLLFWATATWWIPLLIILGVWRHGFKKFPLRYDPSYWGLVFPLGMYTVCTVQLARVTGLDFLRVLPRVFVFLALAAWCLAAFGLVRRLAGLFRGKPGV